MIIQTELIKSIKAHSGNIAIENGEKKMLYSELLVITNQIKDFLLKKTQEKDTIIGICLQDRVDIICSMIGVINAGCTFVLLDASLPKNRFQSMVKDLNLQHIITSKETIQNGVVSGLDTLENYLYENIIENNDIDAKSIPVPEYHENDSLYIYFTSGSTGTPKGIIGKNCSLIQFVNWEIETFNIDSSARFSQFISPYFDAFLRDVFVPLLKGATICIPPKEEDFFTQKNLISWIEKSGISIIHCVPSLFRLINNKDISSENFKNLKYVLLSGEKIIPSELENWYAIFSSRIQLVNLYGTTETTMIRSYYKISPEDVNQDKIPIGSPIHDTELLITKNNFKPCNRLIPGDLYIISDFNTKGYLNEVELTHEKFVKINTGSNKESIAFKTGDKARILANGLIDLIGREDRQIKLRGIRIELDEIENVLIRSKLVENAVVVKNLEKNEDESLIAFIKNDGLSNGDSLIKEANQYLKSYLPEYMIPSKIVVVNDFPLLSNGKINHTELLNYQEVRTIIEPKNEIEENLLTIWKEILGDNLISTEESFQSLGGNSISIMRLIGRIYQDFNVKFSLMDLFENTTIKKQSEFIKTLNKDEIFVIPKTKTKPFYNLSLSQERIYYQYKLNESGIAYNLPLAWEVNGEFDKNKIKNALNLLIERHESLRTEFHFINDTIIQKVKDNVDFKIEEISIQDNNISEAIHNFIRPFKLEEAPLFRCGILTTNEDKKILIVDLHHIICDGKSQQILQDDFLDLYKGKDKMPIEIHYKDYAEWEHNFKASNEYLSYREFWLKSFEKDIPKLGLPTTNLNIDKISEKGGNVNFKIYKKDILPLIDFLKEEEVTTFSGLLSIYFLFLSQLTGQEDVVVGINTLGRSQHEIENLVGMFTKTLPIRNQIDTNMSFKGYVKHLHKYLIQARNKQTFDLTHIVSELNRNKNTPIKDLFDAMFVFQNFEEIKTQTIDEDFSIVDFENTTSKYAISLFASEEHDSFNFRLEYSTLYFTKSDIESLITLFKSLVSKISENLEAEIIEYFDNGLQSPNYTEEDISFNF